MSKLSDLPVAVIGAGGTMARTYVPLLLRLGVKRLLLVETRASCHPGLSQWSDEVVADISLGRAHGKVAFVLSSTPTHCAEIKKLLALGYTNIFTEKPIAQSMTEVADLERALPAFPGARINVAYLIRFSGAILALNEWIKEAAAVPCDIHVEWGKNRTCEERPSSGVLVDEAVHGLGLILDVFRDARAASVSASMRHDPFVNSARQLQAMAADCSFPSEPSSTVHLQVRFERAGDWCSGSIFSSFMRLQRRRSLNGVFRSGSATYLVEAEFDCTDAQGNYDRLVVQQTGEQAPRFDRKFYENKIEAETRAFLASIEPVATCDNRLTSLDEAIQIMRIVDAGKASQADRREVSL